MGSNEQGQDLVVDLSQKLYTPKEVAEMFSVTTYTVREWIRSGELKATRLGKGQRAPYRVPEKELHAFAIERYGDTNE